MADTAPRLMCIATHHKGGARWMQRVFRAMSRRLNLPLIDVRKSAEIPAKGRAFLGHWDGPAPLDLLGCEDIAVLHLIRDPRDIMISGCHDHHVAPSDRAPWLHAARDDLDGRSYQQELHARTLAEDKLRFEMAGRHADTLRDMETWPEDERVITLKMEDLLADADAFLFQAALAHLGLSGEALNKALGVFRRNSPMVTAGGVAPERQTRWPREMPKTLGRDYADRHGDALSRLDYAQDNTWAEALAPAYQGPDFPSSAGARQGLGHHGQSTRQFLKEQGLIAVADKETPDHIRGYGFDVETVIDVGVDQGTPYLYKAFSETPFLLIDPRPECREEIVSRGEPRDFRFECVALGASEDVVTLTIPVTKKGAAGAMAGIRARTDSMATRHGTPETRQVKQVTLDSLTEDVSGRFGLKIDTEGHELDVLLGAPETLKRCDFVILELSVTQRFAGLAPPSRIIALLAEAGLEFRDILRTTGDGRGGPQPRLFDALFTRWSPP